MSGGGSGWGDSFGFTPTPTGGQSPWGEIFPPAQGTPGGFTPQPGLPAEGMGGPDAAQAFQRDVIRPALGGGLPPPPVSGWGSRHGTGSARREAEPEPEHPRVVRGGPSNRGSRAGSHRTAPESEEPTDEESEAARMGMWSPGVPIIKLNFGSLSAKAENYLSLIHISEPTRPY